MSLFISKSCQTSPRTYKKLIQTNDNQNTIHTNNIESPQSVYREDYSLKEILCRPSPFMPRNQIELSTDKFNCHSSYGDEFVLKPISKTKSLKPLTNYVVPIEKLYLDTNYNMDFKSKISEKSFLIKPKDTLVGPSDTTDYYSSSYGNDFVEKDMEKVQNFSPQYTYIPSKQNGQMLSSYQIEFVEVQGSPTRNLRPQLSYEQPSESFQTDTTYKTEFIKSQSYTPTKCFRPENIFQSPEIPFHVSTNYTEDFKNSNGTFIKPFNFKPKSEFIKPEEPFINTTTTYFYDNQKKPEVLVKIPSFKPINNFQMSSVPLDVKTSYMTGFQLNEITSKLDSIKPVHQIQISQEKVDYLTAYGTDYNNGNDHQKPKPYSPNF